MLAMAMCAVVMVSCNKDDDSKSEESNAYLTLQEQQTIFSQAINQLADAVDFSGILPAYDFFMSLHEGQYRILDQNIVKSLKQDSAWNSNFTEFREQLANDSACFADFSKLYFKAEFSSVDTVIDDTVNMIIPVLTKLTPNKDCAQLILNVKGQTIDIRVAGETDKLTTIEFDSNKTSESGTLLGQKQEQYIFPQQSSVEVLFNNQTLVALDLDIDTDLKVKADVVVDNYGDESKDLSFLLTKFDLGLNGQVADMKFNASANYDGEKGIKAVLKSKMDNIELIDATFTLDAAMKEVLADPSSGTLSAWASNYEKLRSIGTRLSLMNQNVTFDGQIRNPMENSKMTSLIAELMSADSITEELSMKIIENIAPYITADCYFKGYRNPQASLAFLYSDSLKTIDLVTELMEKAMQLEKGDIRQLAMEASLAAAIVAAIIDEAGIYPAIQIHNPESFVSIKEYLSGIDFVSGAMTVYQKFNEAFGQLVEIIRTAMGTDEE